MIFDSHVHYDDKQFENDREELFGQLSNFGVEKLVNIGASIKTSLQSISLAKQYPFIYASVGVHPNETAELTEETFEILKQAAKEEKVVAIGEIGLDYYWDEPEHEIQKYWFLRQLDLALERNMPVVIHSREAAADTLSILQKAVGKAKELCIPWKGVMHCFSYGVEMAEKYLEMGFYFGIGGVVTFKNARKLKEVVQFLPIKNILLETDCPYLAPEPHRGKRNSSPYLSYVVKEIAQIKGMSEEEVSRITFENACCFYNILTDKENGEKHG